MDQDGATPSLEALLKIQKSTPDLREREKRMATVLRQFQGGLQREKEKLARMGAEFDEMQLIYQPQKDQFHRSDMYEKGSAQLLQALVANGKQDITAEQVVNLKTAVNQHLFQLPQVKGKRLVIRRKSQIPPPMEIRSDLEGSSGPHAFHEATEVIPPQDKGHAMEVENDLETFCLVQSAVNQDVEAPEVISPSDKGQAMEVENDLETFCLEQSAVNQDVEAPEVISPSDKGQAMEIEHDLEASCLEHPAVDQDVVASEVIPPSDKGQAMENENDLEASTFKVPSVDQVVVAQEVIPPSDDLESTPADISDPGLLLATDPSDIPLKPVQNEELQDIEPDSDQDFPFMRSPSSPTPSEVEEKCVAFIQGEVLNLYEQEKAQQAQENLERIRQQENQRLQELMIQEQNDIQKRHQAHQLAWDNYSKSETYKKEQKILEDQRRREQEWLQWQQESLRQIAEENRRKLAEEHQRKLAEENQRRLQEEAERRRRLQEQAEFNRRMQQAEEERRRAEHYYRIQHRNHKRFY